MYICIVIDDLFSKEECHQLMARSEQQGYEEALVNIGGGRQQKLSHVRNSDRCIMDDPVLAEEIWQRILQTLNSLPPSQREKVYEPDALQLDDKLYTRSSGWWTAVGLNERLRFLRYKPGTFFKPHQDGQYTRANAEAGGDMRVGETSFVTCQLYLNDNFEGGATRFHKSPRERDGCVSEVHPKMGSVLLFQHDLLHEGCLVASGQKYVIRTDVMYTERGPGHEYSREPIVMNSSPMEE